MNKHLTRGEADDACLRDTPKDISKRPGTVTTVLNFALTIYGHARPSRLATCKSAFEGRVEKQRTLVASTMEGAELRKLADPECSVSPRPTLQPLVVTNQHDIRALTGSRCRKGSRPASTSQGRAWAMGTIVRTR